jgi:MFS family permease
MIQGIGVGGEWGGSVLFSMEWAGSDKHRGFITSWPQFGGPAGLFLANMAVLLGSWIAGDSFFAWGWRIPFWLSIIMVAIGLYIRLGILETPVFQRIVAQKRVERVPAIEVLKRQPKQVFLSMLCRSAEQGPAYIYLAFVFTYTGQVLHQPRNFILTALICAGLVSFITIPAAGALSDRFGRKRIYIIGSILTGIYGFIYFALLNTVVPALIVIAIILSFVPHDLIYGPQAALISEGFTPRLRYSGSSIGYQLASLTAGGPAPIIATALLAAYGSGYAVAVYVAVMAVVSVVATAFMPDYTGRDISQEHSFAVAPDAATSG